MSRYRVENWSEYNKSLINRGNLTFWVSADALKKWQAKKDPHFIGKPPVFSDDAILCLMTIKIVFHLPFRQLIGFVTSLFLIMGLRLTIPHFTTLADRARKLKIAVKKLSSKGPKDIVFDSSGFKIYGEGEWKVRQHGKQNRRRWKKMHIGICPETHEIIIAEATELEEADCKVMPRMIKHLPKSVKRAIGDGAFDTLDCYQAAFEQGIELIAPPRRGAVKRSSNFAWEEKRNGVISEIIGLGNDEEAISLWKKLVGYHQRSLVETAFSRFKGIFGSKLFGKSIESQEVELLLKAHILNQMTRLGMPKGVMI